MLMLMHQHSCGGTLNRKSVVQAQDKTFRLIPERWHVLLKEPGNEKILEEVITWLKARL